METVMEWVSAMCRPRNAAPANCEGGGKWEGVSERHSPLSCTSRDDCPSPLSPYHSRRGGECLEAEADVCRHHHHEANLQGERGRLRGIGGRTVGGQEEGEQGRSQGATGVGGERGDRNLGGEEGASGRQLWQSGRHPDCYGRIVMGSSAAAHCDCAHSARSQAGSSIIVGRGG